MRDHAVQLGGADRHGMAAEAELLERLVAREEAELARQVDEPPLRVVDLRGAAGRLELLGDAGEPGVQIGGPGHPGIRTTRRARALCVRSGRDPAGPRRPLVVRDYDEALRYYVGALGFELLEDAPLTDEKRWVVVAPPGGGTALLLAARRHGRQATRVGDQTGGRVAFFLEQRRLRRRPRAAARRRGALHRAPREEPYGTVAVFEDLYGNRWDLLERG